MFIRMLVGRYAGEIRDVQNEAARMLLEKKAAEDPYSDAPAVPGVLAELSRDAKPAKQAIRKTKARA